MTDCRTVAQAPHLRGEGQRRTPGREEASANAAGESASRADAPHSDRSDSRIRIPTVRRPLDSHTMRANDAASPQALAVLQHCFLSLLILRRSSFNREERPTNPRSLSPPLSLFLSFSLSHVLNTRTHTHTHTHTHALTHAHTHTKHTHTETSKTGIYAQKEFGTVYARTFPAHTIGS